MTKCTNIGICTNHLGAAVLCDGKKHEAKVYANGKAAVLYGRYGYLHGAVDGYALTYAVRYASHNPYASTHITSLVLAAVPAVDGDFIKKMEWIRLNQICCSFLPNRTAVGTACAVAVAGFFSSVGPQGYAAPVSVAAA